MSSPNWLPGRQEVGEVVWKRVERLVMAVQNATLSNLAMSGWRSRKSGVIQV